MSDQTQSFQNHAKIVPGYHRYTTALVALPMLYFGYRTVLDFSVDRLALFVFAVGVIFVGFYARFFPLRAQDRVIRLEERMRMERLLPADLKGRISEIGTRQTVALRFAADEELPELVRRVLDEKITDPKEIKGTIKTWRPDHERM
jgi:hypothetical protein